MDSDQELVRLIGTDDVSGYVRSLSPIQLPEGGYRQLAEVLRSFFHPGERYMRLCRNEYSDDEEDWNWEIDFLETRFEEMEVRDETESHYASIRAEFSTVGWELAFTPSAQIKYGVSADRRGFYLANRDDVKMRKRLPLDFSGFEDLYIKLDS